MECRALLVQHGATNCEYMGLPIVNTFPCDVEKRVVSRQYASQLIEHRALLIEYRALLTECRSLLIECRALLTEWRALLTECRALLTECGALLTPHRAANCEYIHM